MFAGPMTQIVALALVGCFAVGVGLMWRAWRSRARAGRRQVCSRCRAVNPVRAKYCAQCGNPLD